MLKVCTKQWLHSVGDNCSRIRVPRFKMANPGSIDFTVVKNEKGKASIWTYFGLKKIKSTGKIEPNIAICRKCDQAIKYSGGTTNLATHLRRHHAAILPATMKAPPTPSQVSNTERPSLSHFDNNEIPRLNQRTVKDCFSAGTKYKSTSPRATLINTKVARFIIKGLQPYMVVEGQEFRDLLNTLDPKYQAPSRKQFSEIIIPQMYNTVKQGVLQSISKAEQVNNNNYP